MERIVKNNEAGNAAGIQRSPEWPKAKEAHLIIEPHCAACFEGSKKTGCLQVHHIFPFQYCIALGRPDLELDQRNLITLCENEETHPGENHHLLIGHLDDFKSFNINVKQDARITFHGLSASAIRWFSSWQKKHQNKPQELEQMTSQEKKELKALINRTFPKN